MDLQLNMENLQKLKLSIKIKVLVRDGYIKEGINMELTFADKNTEMIYKKKFSKKIPHQIQKTAYKKLALLDEADSVGDLKAIPSNRLEFLKGSMKG